MHPAHLVLTLIAHAAVLGEPTAIAWSSDSRFIATASAFGTSISLLTFTGTVVGTLQRGGLDLSPSIALLPGNKILFGSSSPTKASSSPLSIWDPVHGKLEPGPLGTGVASVYDASLEMSVVAVASPPEGVQEYDLSTWRLRGTARIPEPISAIGLLGKKSAVVGTTRGRLYKINTQSNEVAPITDLFVSTHNDISVNVGQICCLAFNPSNSEVVVGEGLPSIMLTSVATKRFGAFMRVMPKNRSQTLAILSPISGAIRAEFGEQLRPPIQSVAWDPQNRYILVTDSTRQIFASTPAEPQLLEVVNEASVERPTLAVSPDGNRLAVASTQGLDIFGVSLENSGASDRSQP